MPPSSSTLTGAELPQTKGVFRLCVQGHFGHVGVCDCVHSGLPGFSFRDGGSAGKNTGVYRPTLAAIPFWSAVFPAVLATNSAEYLVLPEPLRPKHLHHLHTWPSQGQNSSPPGQPQEQSPVDNPPAEVEIKSQFKPRGSVANKKDQKPPHQLYKLQIKST